MGRVIVRQTPNGLPTSAEVAEWAATKTKVNFQVAGSRVPKSEVNTKANKEPTFETHGQHRWVSGQAKDFAGKHLIIFVHGYNVKAREAVISAAEFFDRLNSALARDGVDPNTCAFLLFTWPGDVGVVYFNDAQLYAHHSGVAMYELIREVVNAGPPVSLSVAAHSLGAHVALRSAAVLGIRRVDKKVNFRMQRMLLLGAAVEDDVFERADNHINEYHFPEAAFGVERLHFTCSRGDEVLASAFRVNEFDQALGLAGPPTMEPLASLARRNEELFGDEFTFRLHDLSPNSSTIMNPALSVDNHGDYWAADVQLDYYVNYLR